MSIWSCDHFPDSVDFITIRQKSAHAEEHQYRIYRADRAFGDAIYLLDAGIQIVPSDMGSKPLNGMHGFIPADKHSCAAILSNTELPENIEHVADYFNFMIERADNL